MRLAAHSALYFMKSREMRTLALSEFFNVSGGTPEREYDHPPHYIVQDRAMWMGSIEYTSPAPSGENTEFGGYVASPTVTPPPTYTGNGNTAGEWAPYIVQQ